MWQTAAVDKQTGRFYFQSHVIVGDDTTDCAMLDMFYVTSIVDPAPYPVINPAMDPMQFGYMVGIYILDCIVVVIAIIYLFFHIYLFCII